MIEHLDATPTSFQGGGLSNMFLAVVAIPFGIFKLFLIYSFTNKGPNSLTKQFDGI